MNLHTQMENLQGSYLLGGTAKDSLCSQASSQVEEKQAFSIFQATWSTNAALGVWRINQSQWIPVAECIDPNHNPARQKGHEEQQTNYICAATVFYGPILGQIVLVSGIGTANSIRHVLGLL